MGVAQDDTIVRGSAWSYVYVVNLLKPVQWDKYLTQVDCVTLAEDKA